MLISEKYNTQIEKHISQELIDTQNYGQCIKACMRPTSTVCYKHSLSWLVGVFGHHYRDLFTSLIIWATWCEQVWLYAHRAYSQNFKWSRDRKAKRFHKIRK